jgi:hypothetical protein
MGYKTHHIPVDAILTFKKQNVFYAACGEMVHKSESRQEPTCEACKKWLEEKLKETVPPF